MNKNVNKVILIYLLIVYGTCYLLGLLELISGNGIYYQILGICFTFIPVIAFFITKKITGEKAKYHLSLSVWKNKKYWFISSLLIGILIVLGAIIYYFVFKEQYSGIFKFMDKEIIVKCPLIFALLSVMIATILFPIHLLELGEEIGWRGYLLGFEVEKYGERKAIIINGLEWGFAHLPLVYFGFNYSLDNIGAPWSNMIVMMIACLVFGIILSYVTIKTENCMYAGILHGVINIVGELPVHFSINLKNGLLGPNPIGILAMIPLIIMAIICLFKLDKSR